jgi:hypothetical protein
VGPTDPTGGDLVASEPSPAPVAQGIEHCPPEAGAQVRILPGALTNAQVRALALTLQARLVAIFPTVFQHAPCRVARCAECLGGPERAAPGSRQSRPRRRPRNPDGISAGVNEGRGQRAA